MASVRSVPHVRTPAAFFGSQRLTAFPAFVIVGVVTTSQGKLQGIARMTKFASLLIAAGLFSLAVPGSAATLTGTTPTGFGSNSGDPYRFEQTQPDRGRYLGSGFAQGSVGSTQTRTLSFNGAFTGNPSDLFSVLYSISVRLDQFSTGGSFDFNLFITPTGLSELQMVDSNGALTPTSSQSAFQTFTGSTSSAILASSGTYRGEIVIMMTGLPGIPGDLGAIDGTPPPSVVLRLDQIALQVAPVPEPSTYMLFGVGLVGLAYVIRRRRAAA